MLAVAAFVLSAGAWAAEAGRVVFVSGEAGTVGKPLAVGDAVQEGDELVTGKNGYVYVRTVDQGLLILRPSSKARIVQYHVDTQVPENTRVKLELVTGVARAVSGEAVKKARQNFRFNTPVAAIGVRGTDFTVFTDQETSSVAVTAGAVVVSGFGGNCAPGGTGPCEHAASRELAAGQPGQMLQVRRGQTQPRLTVGGSTPNTVAPPRNDEPVAKADGVQGVPVLDPLKADLLNQSVVRQNNVPQQPEPQPLPPQIGPSTPIVEVPPELPQAQLLWGRWEAVNGKAPTLAAADTAAATPVARSGSYAIYRTPGTTFQSPEQGSIGFSLAQSEAIVRNEATSAVTMATLQNGKLNVDFGKATFATSFDLIDNQQTFALQAEGKVSRDGQLSGNSQFNKPTNMNVTGAIAGPDGSSAAYIFSSRLDPARVANGVTQWVK
ncbi:FecR family protein [Pseudoduganella umbonata]|uniref:FecR protein domain-containing protein n=1 Tax=Pseudoduganella umbonata TaxID=864828 RepID=A0A7W5E8Y4_9BURK|nr:hypothetical protein [Pseudoduganella umbonata]